MEFIVFIVLLAIVWGAMSIWEKFNHFMANKTEEMYQTHRRNKEHQAEQLNQTNKRSKL